jgi:hypothetical protein
MDNLITIEYFEGDITIPNLGKDEGDDFEINYIAKYQKEYLIKVLGYAMYKDFDTALSGTPAQKWTDLLVGKDYTVDVEGETVTTRWNGLQNTEEVSSIAYYVYFKWLKENYAQLTGTGVGVSSKENATNYVPNFKAVHAWNEYIKLTGNIKNYTYRSNYLYLRDQKNNKYYREDINFIDDSVKLDESLFMYLYHNRTDFTNWIFTNDTRQNVYGI